MEGSEILNVDNKVRQYVNMDPLKKKFFLDRPEFKLQINMRFFLSC